MSQKFEVNKKAVLILDGLVCVASIALGLFWGTFYHEKGWIVAGTGGFLVAVLWCYFMRRILGRGWNFILVFLAAAALGGIVGMIDGVLLHLICWNAGVKGDFMPSTLASAVNVGLIFGLFSGLINGAFWGIFYSILMFMMNRKRKGALENV